jgi:hypothetical protein
MTHIAFSSFADELEKISKKLPIPLPVHKARAAFAKVEVPKALERQLHAYTPPTLGAPKVGP